MKDNKKGVKTEMSRVSADRQIADKSTSLPSKSTNQNSNKKKNTLIHHSKPILPNPPHIFDIQVAVAQRYCIPLTSFRERDRSRRITYPAQIAMYLSYVMTNHSFRQIGWQFGNRHWATVIHATKTVEQRIADNPELAMIVDDLRNKIKHGVFYGDTQPSA